MKFNDDKVYRANEKDVSDEALARSKSNELVRINQEKAEYKEKLSYYTFLRSNSSPVRFKHKQQLFELYIKNKQSWGRAKRLFCLNCLTKDFKKGIGDKLEYYLNRLVSEIEYEEVRLNNKELVTQKAMEALEEARAELDSVQSLTNEDRIKVSYAKVNIAKGYKQMLPREPLFVNNNNINTQKTSNVLNVYDGTRKIEGTDTELEKIAKKYNLSIPQVKGLARNLIEKKKEAIEGFIEIGEEVDADTLIP